MIAAVRSKQLDEAQSLGADSVVALDDEAAMAGLGQVDIVANTVRGPAADRLFAQVRLEGVFASVTGGPADPSS